MRSECPLKVRSRIEMGAWRGKQAPLAHPAPPLVTLWTAAWFTLSLGHGWAPFLIVIPAAGFLLRLFIIQHDCGHGSFFANRLANDWVGRLIGVLTLTPYDWWRRTHAIHHATTGNLDRRGIGDVNTLTVREYQTRSWWGRLKYRLYRNPVVMFGFGPAYLFLLQHRLPVGHMRDGWQPWASTMATNLAIALIVAALTWFIGVKAFLLVHLPIVLLAATIGVWLFYVQHQFEQTAWEHTERWNLHQAAVRQLALRSAFAAALVHSQYRHPPRAPSLQSYSLLSASARAARPFRTARRRSLDAPAKLSVRPACAVG